MQLSDQTVKDIKPMNCEETTLYGYRNIINRHLIPALGEYKLQELVLIILNKYFKEKLESRLKNVNIRKHNDLLKHSLNAALNED